MRSSTERGQPRGWSTTQLVAATFVVGTTFLVIIAERSLLESRRSAPVGTRDARGKALIPEYTGQDSYALQLQPSLASQFVLYLGYNGNCSRAAIHTFHSSRMSLATAMELCQIHPNCTFFSYRREVGVTLCSGRRGTAGNNRINVADSEGQNDPFWVSGDKVGCEDFGYEEALALHHAGTMPSCFFQQASCAFSTGASRRCLSNMLDIRPDRTIRLGGKFLCQNPIFGLSVQSHKTESCAWTIQLQGNKQSNTHYGLHYVTDNTGMEKKRFIPDLIKPTPTGRLASAEVCLCHNAENGLAMGDYCGNSDCYWDPSSAKCLYRNRKTGACITSLIKSHSSPATGTPVQSVCHDMQLDGIYLATQLSTNPDDARCQWHFAHDDLVNDGTRTSLQQILQRREDGTLLAAKPKCLCYNSVSSLHISGTCSAEFCQWTRGRLADPSDSFQEAFQYTVTQRTARYTCVLQLEPLQFVATAQEAFQLCSKMALCTYVAYNQHDGATYLCQGHYGYLEVGPHQHVWLNAFKKGCEQYESTESYHDLLTGHRPSCLKERSCTACPAGSQMTLSCSKNEEAICDTCAHGYCGQLPCRVDTNVAIDGLVVEPEEKPSTISAVKMLGKTYLVTGYAQDVPVTSPDSKQPLSKVSLCEYDPAPNGGVGLCHQIDIRVAISNLDAVVAERTYLYGALQAFQFRGRIYLAAMAHVGFGLGLPDAGHKYPVLLRLAPSLDKVVSGIALECSYDWMLLSEVSLMMLPTWSKLYMVTSVSPLVVMLIDQDTGSCRIVQRDVEPNAFQSQTAGHRLVGTAPLFPLSPDTYLGVVHRKVKYPFGAVYTQHLITLKHDVSHWSVGKLSDGFRLPHSGMQETFDQQMVSGLLVLGGGVPQPGQPNALLVAYTTGGRTVGVGIADAVDAATLVLQLKPSIAEQMKPSDGLVVRWETPIHESSRLAWNGMNLLERLVTIRPEMQLQVRDTSTDWHSRTSLSSGSKLAKHILRANRLHNMPVDMLIRYMWPPNAHRSSTSKRVVQYMPWPFATFPSDWVPDILANIHQVWVPSKFARNVLTEAKIPAAKVHDMPYGMSNATCSYITSRAPRVANRPAFIPTQKAFLYLFNACIEWAHGIDTVLKSFLTTYSKEDDVALVIHNKCGDADANQYVTDMLSQARADPYSPEVIIVSNQLDLEQHFQLRAAVDAFVLPVRADLHAQHVLDAVVFGKPTIVPDQGAHMDWLTTEDVVAVRSSAVPCQMGPCKAMKDGTWNVGGMPTKEGVKWIEVDPVDLSLAMQHARTKTIAPGAAATLAKKLCSQVTWLASAKKILYLQDSIAYRD